CEEVRLTEGPLKADVTWFLDRDVPCLAVASVSTWSRIKPVLGQLGVKKVRIAFDADWENKWQVSMRLDECVEALREQYEVELEFWDVKIAKGIDDLRLLGYQPLRKRVAV